MAILSCFDFQHVDAYLMLLESIATLNVLPRPLDLLSSFDNSLLQNLDCEAACVSSYILLS